LWETALPVDVSPKLWETALPVDVSVATT
jgi:hypothetical protein